MNIDEIYTLINEINSAKVFCASQGLTKLESDNSWFQTAARILVDWTYGAGKAAASLQDVGSWYRQGFEEASKDPKAWYVLDKNGEHIHGGDTVSNAFGNRKVKYIFYEMNNTPCVKFIDGGWDFSADVEKVIPDTREKIIEDLATQFSAIRNDGIVDVDDDLRAFAEQFIARVEALEKR